MNKSELKEKIKSLSIDQEWNHQYDLGDGVFTRSKDINSPGYNTVKWQRLKPILEKLETKNKKFLDVGSSDGFYSIKCAELGAKVLGIEIDELRVQRSNFIKDFLKVENVKFSLKDLYDFQNEEFDVIMALGLLHRIPDMLTFLGKVSQMTNTVILEYKTFDSNKDTVYDGKKETKLNAYNTLHGIPTNTFVKNRLTELGFSNIELFLDTESHLKFKRTICIGSKLNQ